ncbi:MULTISPECIES: hypothetical protein [Sphingobacterium]|uniref:hypothetical protein n=1 Tax=Sphingobacterium TaxID=28453 RepID=UPI0013DC42DA|nr:MULTISPECIES: hypothetical protein [unclassified Sphingobacterium]
MFAHEVKSQCTYNIDAGSTVVNLVGVSTNGPMEAAFVWTFNNTVYVAINSTHDLADMYINSPTVTTTNKEACGVGVNLIVNSNSPGTDPKTGLKGNLNDAKWTFRFDRITLLPYLNDGINYITIHGIGGGHDVNEAQYTFVVPKVDVTVYKNWIGGSNYPSINVTLYGMEANSTTGKMQQ